MNIAPSSNLSRFVLTGSLTLAAGTASHAALVVTLSTPVTLSSSSGSNTLSFNLATGKTVSNGTAADSQFQINYDGGSTGKIRLVGLSGQPTAGVLYNPSTNDVVNLYPVFFQAPSAASGTYVNAAVSQPYLSFNQDNNSQFRYGMLGYAGLQIPDPVNPTQLDYGYAAITVNADNSVTLSQLAYDNVPEPSALATSLLALGGAAGAVAVRHRRLAKISLTATGVDLGTLRPSCERPSA